MTDTDDAARARWTVIGPGGGGTILNPTVSPHDPAHVLVCSDMTGAYVTTDAGGTWRPFNLRAMVRAFEFDPHEPDTVYAASTGLYRSHDRGTHWHLVLPRPEDVTRELATGDHASHWFATSSGLPGGYVVAVRVDPSAPRRLWVGTWDGDVGTVMLSDDRGGTWRAVARVQHPILALFPGRRSGSADDVTILTQGAAVRASVHGSCTPLALPVRQIAAAEGGSDSRRNIVYALAASEHGQGALWRSDDGCATWAPADRSLYDAIAPEQRQISYRTLGVCAGSPETLYLSCGRLPEATDGDARAKAGIARSDDGGASWRWLLEVRDGAVVRGDCDDDWVRRDLGGVRPPYGLGVCPTDPDIVYATDTGRAVRSTNGGRSWRQVISRDLPDGSVVSTGLDVTTSYGVHSDPYDPTHRFVTYSDVGLFRTTNDCASWTRAVEGIPEAWQNTCYWLEFDPAVPGRLFSVWSNVHDLPRRKMLGAGNLGNGRQQGGAALSHDGGQAWHPLTPGVPDSRKEASDSMRPTAVPTHVLIDPESPVDARTLYVCDFGFGVWKSSDTGRTWRPTRTGIAETNRNAWRLTPLPDGTLFLLVARGGIDGREAVSGALYVSTDAAASWTAVPLPACVTAPTDLVCDPSDPSRMYLCAWPLSINGTETGGGLHRTDDGGRSWRQVFDDATHVYAAAIDPRHPATVFLNTFHGAAFRSDDRGESWRRLAGYDFRWGHRPVIDPHDDACLFLTTFGGSVFRRNPVD